MIGMVSSLFVIFLITGLYIYFAFKFPSINDYDGHYSEELIVKKGPYLDNPEEKLQHFLKFTPHKSEKVIRIGTFGDSHTAGDEVDDASSYPRQLQELFNKNFPNKKIEILNFGLPADGFQDQFFLWEQYAKSYHLDYLLFGPRGFYPERDTSFRMSYTKDGKNYLAKARFILSENNDAKLIHIKNRPLMTFWTILRYERELTYLLDPFSLFSRHIGKNPFYYTNMSVGEESFIINRYLLNKMKSQYDKKILFITDDPQIFHFYRRVQNIYNVNYIKFNRSSFYWMPYEHGSSLENEFMANIYFNGLQGKGHFDFDIIHCLPLKTAKIPSNNEKNHHLKSINSIKIMMGRKTLLDLIRNDQGACYSHSSDLSDYWFRVKNKAKSFLSFSKGHPLMNDAHSTVMGLQLPISIKEGMEIFIQTKNKRRILLGLVESLDIEKVFFTFYKKYIYHDHHTSIVNGDDSRKISFALNIDAMPSSLREKVQKIPGKVAELFIGDYKLGLLKFHTSPFSHFKFFFKDGFDNTFVMAGPRSPVRVNDFPSSAIPYIQYNKEDGNVAKSMIPHIQCMKKKHNIVLNLPHFRPLNL